MEGYVIGWSFKMKKILLTLILGMFLLSLASAESSYTFKQGDDFTLEISMSNADLSACLGCTCELSLFYPNGSAMVKNAVGSNVDGFCKYTTSTNVLGNYGGELYFTNGVDYGRSTFEFEITPSGFTNTLGFYILILVLSLGIVIFGISIADAPITILGSFGLYFLGLWILYNGIDSLKDPTYTWAIGLIVLGLAMYISFKSAYELIAD